MFWKVCHPVFCQLCIELLHELLNNLRLRFIGNSEISGKSPEMKLWQWRSKTKQKLIVRYSGLVHFYLVQVFSTALKVIILMFIMQGLNNFTVRKGVTQGPNPLHILLTVLYYSCRHFYLYAMEKTPQLQQIFFFSLKNSKVQKFFIMNWTARKGTSKIISNSYFERFRSFYDEI